MHDDDGIQEAFDFEEPDTYWSEEEWEKRLRENESLIDQYEKVFEENPDRRWDDPADLYYKVHFGLDLGEDLKFPEKPGDFSDDSDSDNVPGWKVESEDEEIATEEVTLHDELDRIAAYRLAFHFALEAMDYLKTEDPGKEPPDSLKQGFCHHALRIAADIAGGHGLGYEEESLCGNIVKNRWALDHAHEAARLVCEILRRDGDSPRLLKFPPTLDRIRQELTRRIADLRSRVWW